VASEGDIIVDGIFEVNQLTSSAFYYGFVNNDKPCILKFNELASQAESEVAFYQRVIQNKHIGCQFLVNVSLVKFNQDFLHEHHKTSERVGLKMNHFVHTLASIPHNFKLAQKYFSCAKQVYSALEAIHSSSYAHCDIKPNNIFLDTNGDCFLGDYDAVKQIGEYVDRITEAFVPREFLILHKGLKASKALDLAMLATTCVFLITDKHILSIKEIKEWCSNNNFDVISVVTECLKVIENDEQFIKGCELLEAKKIEKI